MNRTVYPFGYSIIANGESDTELALAAVAAAEPEHMSCSLDHITELAADTLPPDVIVAQNEALFGPCFVRRFEDGIAPPLAPLPLIITPAQPVITTTVIPANTYQNTPSLLPDDEWRHEHRQYHSQVWTDAAERWMRAGRADIASRCTIEAFYEML